MSLILFRIVVLFMKPILQSFNTKPKLRLISGVGTCLKLDADGKVKSLGCGLSVAMGE